MIEWWGPIIYESTRRPRHGATFHHSEERWPSRFCRAGNGRHDSRARREGQRARSERDRHDQLQRRSTVRVHKDPIKTAEAIDGDGRGTVGDVGYVDEDGYLFLTDRKAFMIISGGVNIYPQEAENLLVTHPKVLDVGVIGVPHPEMGEE